MANEQQNSEGDFQQPLPWTVWLTAYGLCLLGGWSLGCDLAYLFGQHWPREGFGILSFALAWGIFRERNWARVLIAAVAGLTAFVSPLLGILFVFSPDEFVRDASNDLFGSELTPLIARLVLTAYFVINTLIGFLIYRALTRSDIVSRFKTPIAERPIRARWRMSLKAILLLAPVAVSVALPM